MPGSAAISTWEEVEGWEVEGWEVDEVAADCRQAPQLMNSRS